MITNAQRITNVLTQSQNTMKNETRVNTVRVEVLKCSSKDFPPEGCERYEIWRPEIEGKRNLWGMCFFAIPHEEAVIAYREAEKRWFPDVGQWYSVFLVPERSENLKDIKEIRARLDDFKDKIPTIMKALDIAEELSKKCEVEIDMYYDESIR